jgi:DMSO/TMAO reductase YedYZ molybdopterin-dependent catalytic subunit
VPDDLNTRKERWARKMAGKETRVARSGDRLPPGQHEVSDFPVLDLGIKPELPDTEWRLKIHGEVENSVDLTWEQFGELPQFTDVCDFHCVTTWSQFDLEFSGVAFFSIADLVKPKPSAQHVIMQSYDGYTTNLTLEAMLDDDVMIAHSWRGEALTTKHGGPARVLVPKLYAWKSPKWIREIKFSTTDEPGYWERRGYSNTADPFTNDRFSHSSS